MLVAVSSINGSPGVSAWTLMLAAAWPGSQTRVLVEADSSGGVLAVRYGLSSDPGVISLVSQARLHPGQRPDIQSCGRRLDESLWCIPGPETAEGAGHIWSSGAGPLAESLAVDDRLWFVDCGRIYPNTTLAPLLSACDMHLLFTGASTESLVAVPSRVSWLAESTPTAVVSVGKSGRQESEMLSFFGSDQVWQIDYYRDLAETAGQIFESGRARRSKAWRAAVDLADKVASWHSDRNDSSKAGNSQNRPLPATPSGSPALADRTPPLPDANQMPPPTPPLPSPEPARASVSTQPNAAVQHRIAASNSTASNSTASNSTASNSTSSDGTASNGTASNRDVDNLKAAGSLPPAVPKMPGHEFRESHQVPPLPPASAKSGWYEPLAGTSDQESASAARPSEAG